MSEELSQAIRVGTLIMSGYGAVLSTWNFLKASTARFEIAFFEDSLDEDGDQITASFINYQRPVFVRQLSIVVIVSISDHKVVQSNKHNSFAVSNGVLSVNAKKKNMGAGMVYYAKVVGVNGRVIAQKIGNKDIGFARSIFWWVVIIIRRLSRVDG